MDRVRAGPHARIHSPRARPARRWRSRRRTAGFIPRAPGRRMVRVRSGAHAGFTPRAPGRRVDGAAARGRRRLHSPCARSPDALRRARLDSLPARPARRPRMQRLDRLRSFTPRAPGPPRARALVPRCRSPSLPARPARSRGPCGKAELDGGSDCTTARMRRTLSSNVRSSTMRLFRHRRFPDPCASTRLV